MRTILRAILATMLLLGGAAADWAPVQAQTHESCCCGMAGGAGDGCPCPKPEGNRAPSQGACTQRQTVAATPAPSRAEQGQRRAEPRPEPATWAAASNESGSTHSSIPAQGRDPDLGRHLARLGMLRI